MCASKALTSLTARKRPGLIRQHEWLRLVEAKKKKTPSVSPISEAKVSCRRRSGLVPGHSVAITFTKLRKTEAIEFLGVWIDLCIHLDSTGWVAISVPAGTVTPLENVNGRNARRATV